jgi:hypothetical protein
MVLYQRDLSRKLADQDSAVAQLQAALGAEWDIEVTEYVLFLLPVRQPWSNSRLHRVAVFGSCGFWYCLEILYPVAVYRALSTELCWILAQLSNSFIRPGTDALHWPVALHAGPPPGRRRPLGDPARLPVHAAAVPAPAGAHL